MYSQRAPYEKIIEPARLAGHASASVLFDARARRILPCGEGTGEPWADALDHPWWAVDRRHTAITLELPDGVQFEQYVLRIPKAAMMVVLDDEDRVLMMWRHRFIIDRWV
jgi:hypothetical protein